MKARETLLTRSLGLLCACYAAVLQFPDAAGRAWDGLYTSVWCWAIVNRVDWLRALFLSALVAGTSAQAGPRLQTVTHYCACERCCGDWSGLNRTASGTVPRAGRTIAGPSWVPFGTRVWIHGYGWRVVEDRTATRYDGRWDVYVRTHGEARRLGRRWLEVRIVGRS